MFKIIAWFCGMPNKSNALIRSCLITWLTACFIHSFFHSSIYYSVLLSLLPAIYPFTYIFITVLIGVYWSLRTVSLPTVLSGNCLVPLVHSCSPHTRRRRRSSWRASPVPPSPQPGSCPMELSSWRKETAAPNSEHSKYWRNSPETNKRRSIQLEIYT